MSAISLLNDYISSRLITSSLLTFDQYCLATVFHCHPLILQPRVAHIMLSSDLRLTKRLKVMFGSRYSAPRILNLVPQARLDHHPSWPAREVRHHSQTRSVPQAPFRQHQPDVPPEPHLELRLQ